jgi:3-phosphoshikimate 1-carboxyvinyltransferase
MSRHPTPADLAVLPIDQWPSLVRVPPVTRPVSVTIRPPGSKSITNRALLLAALADGTSTLTGALVDADDAQVMIRALRQLGAQIDITPELDDRGETSGNATLTVRGVAGRWIVPPGQRVLLNLNNAGTATRFLTAAAILQPANADGIVIDGNARMRQRPIGELIDALREAGLQAEYLGEQGYPPVLVKPIGDADAQALRFAFGVTQSSQFISAVMLISPFLRHGLWLRLPTNVTSAEYVQMTKGLLQRFDQKSGEVQNGEVYFGPLHTPRRSTSVHGVELGIEADASSGTYFLAAGIIQPYCKVGMAGDGYTSGVFHDHYNGYSIDRRLQPDFHFYDAAKQFASPPSPNTWQPPPPLRPANLDMRSMPDAAMTAAVVASFANGISTITGLRTLRVKETDRIAAMVSELAKVGVNVEPFTYTDDQGRPDEGIRIIPPHGGIDCSPMAPEVIFHTYDDHRMAMSLALIGLRRPNVLVHDPACVRKTYPTFWRDLTRLYA